MSDQLVSVLAARVHETQARLGGHAGRVRAQRARAVMWRDRALALQADLRVARVRVARLERRVARLEADLVDCREGRDYLRRRLADVSRNTTAGCPEVVEAEGQPAEGVYA